MSAREKTRVPGFDALKGIACIAVVFMHCEFPGVVGTYIQCLTRWSVPLFFAVSGYFFQREEVSYALAKAKHILNITVWATLFYIAFECLLHLWGGDLLVYVAEELNFINIVAFVVFNSPIFVNGHLWFLFALLYVYLSYAVMIRLSLIKYEKQIGIVLLVCFFVLSYGFYLLGHPLQAGFYRNFLFEGLPFFLFGKYMRESILPKLYENRSKLAGGGICLLLGCLLSVMERYLIGRDFSLHISSVIILTALLILAMSGSLERVPKLITLLGRDYSMVVYVIHPAIYLTMDSLCEVWSDNIVYLWLRPIITVILSIIVTKLFLNIKGRIAERNH